MLTEVVVLMPGAGCQGEAGHRCGVLVPATAGSRRPLAYANASKGRQNIDSRITPSTTR
jgi:hypothetical protein